MGRYGHKELRWKLAQSSFLYLVCAYWHHFSYYGCPLHGGDLVPGKIWSDAHPLINSYSRGDEALCLVQPRSRDMLMYMARDLLAENRPLVE